MSRVVTSSLITLALLALGVFVGGLLALGALAAPVVFGVVPAPYSADAMTIVFRRFDRVAMVCVAIVLLVEAILARGSVGRAKITGPLLASTLAALVLYGALFVSPRIEALHLGGAIRGLGPDGLQLEHAHAIAEALGKGELLLAVALFILHVFAIPRRSPLVGA